jgi:hypothetical protein
MKKILGVLVTFLLAGAGLTLAAPAANAAYPGTVTTTCSGVAKEIKRAGRNTVRVKGTVTAGNTTPAGTVTIKVARKASKSGAAPIFSARFTRVKAGTRRVTVSFAPAADSPFKPCSASTTIRVHR